MSGNSKTIIAYNYIGSKFTWVNELYQHFPGQFTHLVDLFAGSLVVSLNFKGKVVKTANEINSDITNFFQVLRDHQDELMRLLLLTPVSKTEFNNCWSYSSDNVENARRFYVRCRQSIYGLGAQSKSKGWHLAVTKNNSRGGETVSRWNNGIKKLYTVADAIRENFQITNYDYSECIDKTDFEGAFFYIDPPYPAETRNSQNDYKYEFSTEDHIRLSIRLHSIRGKAMISSYNSKLYSELYNDWRKVEFPIKNNNIRSTRVKEVIWMNYDPSQSNLFSE